jgi:hypothetical protein
MTRDGCTTGAITGQREGSDIPITKSIERAGRGAPTRLFLSVEQQ